MYTETVTEFHHKKVVSFTPLIKSLNPFIWIVGASSLCHLTKNSSFRPANLPNCDHVIGATTKLLYDFIKSCPFPINCDMKLIFCGGLNDIMQDCPVEEIVDSIEKIIKYVRLQNKKFTIVLTTIPYIPKLWYSAFKMKQISYMNEYITNKNSQMQVPTLKLCHFQSCWSFKADGVHLTSAAKQIVASDLSKLLNTL